MSVRIGWARFAPGCLTSNPLSDSVVKAVVLNAGDPVFQSRQNDSSDLKMNVPVDTLPGGIESTLDLMGLLFPSYG